MGMVIQYGISLIIIYMFYFYVGVDEANDANLTLSESRNDGIRIKYHQDHLSYIQKAIEYVFEKLCL